MVVTDTLEGVVDDAYWYHYDVRDDVLYLRLSTDRDTPTLGEEDEDGVIVLRDEATRRVVGLTVVNWWSRFGQGQLPDSIREIQRHIQPWAGKVAA